MRAAHGVRLRRALRPADLDAVRLLLRRVRAEVPARLVHASLFGSRARCDARPDSDLDVLLVFHRLPWDREPQASIAERIAADAAGETGVPVTVWSVSLPDLAPGERTPMLVDALDDSVPLWWEDEPLRPVAFTPADAVRCVGALLARVGEGSDEFAWHLGRGDEPAALRRLRDDLVRLATGLLLLRGVTRPRRGEAAEALLRGLAPSALPPPVRAALGWAAAGFGPHGRDEDAALSPPPGGLEAGARSAAWLRGALARERMAGARGPERNLPPRRAYR